LATLRFLTKHLPASLGLPENGVAIMHGGLTDEEQQRVVDEFKQAGSPIRVLVTGDVASEGRTCTPSATTSSTTTSRGA